MAVPESIHDYLKMFAGELGERILQTYPALHSASDAVSPRLATTGPWWERTELTLSSSDLKGRRSPV